MLSLGRGPGVQQSVLPAGNAAPLSLRQGEPGRQLPSSAQAWDAPAGAAREEGDRRPGGGTVKCGSPGRRGRALYLLQSVANFCIPARAPALSGKPCLGSLGGQWGLATVARHRGFPGMHTEGAACHATVPAGRGAQVPGRHSPASARPGPRGHIWAWALFGCTHTCADRWYSGPRLPQCRRPGGELGNQGERERR